MLHSNHKTTKRMVKTAGKRSSLGPAAPPAVVVPKKADQHLQSLANFGDNLEVYDCTWVVLHLPVITLVIVITKGNQSTGVVCPTSPL